MRRTLIALAASAAFIAPVFATPAFAADTPAPKDAAEAAKKPDADTAVASVAESAHPVQRSIPFHGGTLAYTVTPGTLTIRNDEGAPIHSIFYTAYTIASPKGAAARPVTFVFNGGPGSSSMWLHMGSFGPMKIDAATTTTLSPAPYRFGPNPDTLLDKTDLVFIDAPTTGLSRPLGKAEPKDFFGVDADLNAFTLAIQRYLTINGRWDSPKFIIGESYGTLRAAGLSYSLQQKGVQLNGVALLSSVLDIGLLFEPYDQSFVAIVPTYAAAAAYHNRLQSKPADLNAYLAEVRAFASGPYAAALFKGDNVPAAEREAVAKQLAAYIGVSPDFVLRNKLRVDPDRFRKELLRDQGKTIGRLDARFEGEDVDNAGEGTEYDPTDAAMTGAWVSTLNDYLFRDLGYQTPLSYRPNNYAAQGGSGWNWQHRVAGGRPQMTADTSVDLSAAMRRDPHMKLLSLNGLYDMATPFFGAEYDLSHMSLQPDRLSNITYRYYPSGHMVYIEPKSAHQLQADIEAWIDSAR